ncbi:metallophosphoesterase [Clostridium sp. 19966]|uniref:metallophosphoesterase family protein n=1 Tax=Clostridium sp. 19966 TaxID=2768166 RepID=UPI0037BE6387
MVVADVESPYIWDYFQPEKFSDIDIMISCGDLKAEYLSFLVTMIKAPLFYVPGNHNDKYLKNPPEGCVNIDDKIVKYKGVRILGLGGSKKYNNGYYQYTEHQMKKRISKLRPKIWWNGGADIFVAHSPALGIGDGLDKPHRGFQCFYKIFDRYKPKYFLHGHQHLSYTYKNDRIRKYNEVTIINGYDYYIFEY